MPARASFDTLIKYLSCCTGSLYYISKKTYKRKKMRKRKSEGSKQC